AWAQTSQIRGQVISNGQPVIFGHVGILKINKGASTDENGHFELLSVPYGTHELMVSCVGYETKKLSVTIDSATPLALTIELKAASSALDEVVVTGTMKPVTRTESPVPVSIITPKLFRKNPTPSLFEAVGLINGVQPQINCNVCNTGDIHINGMEGPYTM